MMGRIIAAGAFVSLLAGSPAQAAQDPGLTLHDGPGGARALGVGVQAGVTIRLGGAPRAAAERAPRLSLRAGPSLARTGLAVAPRQRTTVAPFAELALRPAHSTRLTLAGQPLTVRYATPALREQEAGPRGVRSNISTVGIVAIGVGVAVIVGGLLFVDAVRDSSD